MERGIKPKICSELEVGHNSSLNELIMIINYFGEYDLLKKVLYFISNNYKYADSFLKFRYAEELFDVMEKKVNFMSMHPKKF